MTFCLIFVAIVKDWAIVATKYNQCVVREAFVCQHLCQFTDTPIKFEDGVTSRP